MKKISLLILVFGILVCNISCKSYAQKPNHYKTFITSDSLAYIYILPKGEFGYISYKGQSPLSYKHDKNIIKGHIDGPYFTINEHGSGKYFYKKDKLILKFIKPKNSIDSISIKKTKSKQDIDSVGIKIIFKSYTKNQTDEGIGIGSVIKSSDSLINHNTMFDDYALIRIAKQNIPVKLIINGNYQIKIKEKTNQEIELFINQFKQITTENIKNKTFDIKTFIPLNKE
jgi:hypothetical protein